MPKYAARRDGFQVISCCAWIIFSPFYEAASMTGKKNTLRFLVLKTAYTGIYINYSNNVKVPHTTTCDPLEPIS